MKQHYNNECDDVISAVYYFTVMSDLFVYLVIYFTPPTQIIQTTGQLDYSVCVFMWSNCISVIRAF